MRAEVDGARIGAGSDDNHFWLVLKGKAFDFFVIDSAGLFFNTIRNDIVELARKVNG